MSATMLTDPDKSSETSSCKPEINKSSSKMSTEKNTTSNTSLSTSNKSASQSIDSDNSNISRKTEANNSSLKLAANKKATRVVESRYKMAAVKKDGSKNNSSGMLDSTLSTTMVVPKIVVSKEKKLQSNSNRSNTQKDPAGNNSWKSTSTSKRPTTIKRSESHKENISGNTLKPTTSLKRSASVKKQLHSTALDATYLNATCLEQTVITDPCKFSTTVVSGKPGNISPKITEAFGELPDLSDISIIAQPSKVKHVVELEKPTVTTTAAVRAAVTEEDLEQAHLQALLWQLLDVESDHAAQVQEKEAMNQLIYLDQLTKEKQKEHQDILEKLQLLEEAERADKAYKSQMKDLKLLSDYMPAIGEATKSLSRGLEKTLHQIHTKDIYTPQDDVQYGANFEMALDEHLKLLEELENKVQPKQESIFGFQKHVKDTQMVSNMMQECSIKIQQSESLAVQEASLRLGGTQKVTR